MASLTTTSFITPRLPSTAPDLAVLIAAVCTVRTAAVGCVSTCPVPTTTVVPLLSTLFTTTNYSTGPGVSGFAFGGTCETYRTYDLTLFVVHVVEL